MPRIPDGRFKYDIVRASLRASAARDKQNGAPWDDARVRSEIEQRAGYLSDEMKAALAKEIKGHD